MIDKTGPNISSCAIIDSLFTFTNIVGLTKYPSLKPSGLPKPPISNSQPSLIPALI